LNLESPSLTLDTAFQKLRISGMELEQLETELHEDDIGESENSDSDSQTSCQFLGESSMQGDLPPEEKWSSRELEAEPQEEEEEESVGEVYRTHALPVHLLEEEAVAVEVSELRKEEEEESSDDEPAGSGLRKEEAEESSDDEPAGSGLRKKEDEESSDDEPDGSGLRTGKEIEEYGSTHVGQYIGSRGALGA
jgi:hypothetical protein